jgi:glycosyltransferase involved in cell wall biosynthesis
MSARIGRKVLFVAHNFPPGGLGGVEVYTRNLTGALREAGHDISILYPREAAAGEAESIEESRYEGIRIHRAVVRKAAHRKIRKRYLARSSRFHPVTEKLFGDLLDRETPDLVHFHNLHINLPFSLLEIARDRELPVCLTLHDAWLICPRTHLYIPEKRVVSSGPASAEKCLDCLFLGAWPIGKQDVGRMIRERQEYARRVLDSVDVITAPSRYLASRFMENGFARGRIVVSPLGVQPIEVPIRAKEPGVVVFGAFGSIHRLKNILHLVDSFRAVPGAARLVLWGNGNTRYIEKVLRSARKDRRIEYRGPYSPDQIPSILSEIDIAVVPSFIENYPLVVREALAGKVPVAASDVGGIPEVVEHGRNGLLFDPNDRYALRRVLTEIVGDPAWIDRLRAGIEPLRTIREDALEWEKRYEALLGGRLR